MPTYEDSEDIANYCLDLQYPEFDTLGREESSIPDDVEKASPVDFVLAIIDPSRITGIEYPWVDIDEDKVGEFADKIKLKGHDNVPYPVLNRKLEPIDGWHRTLALVEAKIPSHKFWIPNRPATIKRLLAIKGIIA